MRTLILIVATLMVAALPGPAVASTASIAGSMVTISGGAEANDIDVNIGSDRIHDAAGITAGSGCTQEAATTVYCGSLIGTWITADLGAGDDEIGVLGRGQLWEVRGGPGDDTIRGEDADNWLFGEAGWDVLFGYGGDDTIDGGPGSDQLHGDGIYQDYGGNDTLQARDGEYDDVSCGWGVDVATVDPIDNVFVECEQVDRGGPTPIPEPTPQPTPVPSPQPQPQPQAEQLPTMTVAAAKRAVRRFLGKRYRAWRKGTRKQIAGSRRASRVSVSFRKVSVRYRARTYRGRATAKYYWRSGKVAVKTTARLRRVS